MQRTPVINHPQYQKWVAINISQPSNVLGLSHQKVSSVYREPQECRMFCAEAVRRRSHVALLTFSAFSRQNVAPLGKRPSLGSYKNLIAKWQPRILRMGW